MTDIISISVLLLSLSFFFIERSTKLEIIFTSTLCLTFASFKYVSFGSCPKMLCFFFFLSEIKYVKDYIRGLNGTPFKWLMLLMCFGVITVILTSAHADNLRIILGLIVNDLIAKYFIIVYVFVAFKGKSELYNLYKIAYICLIVITIIGLFSFTTGIYPAQLMTGNSRLIHQLSELGRIRISSLFIYAFDYGFACNVLLIFFLYGKFKEYVSSQRFYTAVVCCLIGILICGCRTVIFTTVISIFTYFIFKSGTIKTVAYFFGVCYIGFIAVTFSNKISEKVDNTLTALDYEHTEKGASSLSGRETQYLTVFKFISGHELTGRGYRFIKEDLGFGKNGNGQDDLEGEARKLLGIEGVLMGILLERGYIGVFFYLTFYVAIIIFALHLRKKSPSEIAVVLSCLVAFISYANMTGELMSSTITMFLSGAFFKLACQNINRLNYNED